MNYYCKGICHNYKKKSRGSGHRFYLNEKKRCRPCQIFIQWEGLRCPCCGSKLRTRPEKKRNRLQFYKEKLLNSILPKMEISKSLVSLK